MGTVSQKSTPDSDKASESEQAVLMGTAPHTMSADVSDWAHNVVDPWDPDFRVDYDADEEGPVNNEADLQVLDDNDPTVVLDRFMAFLKKFDRNEVRVDQSDQPNDLLRPNARPVKTNLQDPEARRNQRCKSRFCFLMVVGAMKCFNKSMRTVTKTLKKDGFVSNNRITGDEHKNFTSFAPSSTNSTSIWSKSRSMPRVGK